MPSWLQDVICYSVRVIYSFTDGRVVSTVGLVFDIVGAVFLACGLWISKEEAVRRGGTYWMSDDDEENLKIPPIAAILRDSKRARTGLVLLIIGFALQIVGIWMD